MDISVDELEKNRNDMWNNAKEKETIEKLFKSSFTADEFNLVRWVLYNEIVCLNNNKSIDNKKYSLFVGIIGLLIKDFIQYNKIFSIQPMLGPVNLVFYEKSPGNVVTQAIEAKSNKLQSGWTTEANYDLEKLHGLNIDDEIKTVLVDEISRELLTYILKSLKEIPIRSIDRDKDILITEIINESINLKHKNGFGEGNFVLVSKNIYTLLTDKKIKNNKAIIDTGDVINDTIKIIVVDCYLSSEVIVGYKDINTQLQSALIYCPYIPLMFNDYKDFVTGLHVSSIFTRNAICIAENNIDNLSKYYTRLKLED